MAELLRRTFLAGPGFGYRLAEIDRELPEAAATAGK